MRAGCDPEEVASNGRLPRYSGDVWDMSQSDWESIIENGIASEGAAYRAPGRAARAIAQGAPSIPEEGLSNDAYALTFILFADAVAAGFSSVFAEKRGGLLPLRWRPLRNHLPELARRRLSTLEA